MTQENKELLLKDICARLPYGVKGLVAFNGNIFKDEDRTIDGKLYDRFAEFQDSWYDNVTIKPYLFPLSSMTEEQYYELQNCSSDDCLEHMELVKTLRECTDFTHWPLYEYRVIDWLNKNHFDYRGLIEKGLAIDATGLNIY